MASSLSAVAHKVFGSKNDRELKRLRPMVAAINELEPQISAESDDRLREYLGAFHHLPAVLAGDTGFPGEPVGPISLHVEEFEQALDRPLNLIGIRGQIQSHLSLLNGVCMMSWPRQTGHRSA